MGAGNVTVPFVNIQRRPCFVFSGIDRWGLPGGRDSTGYYGWAGTMFEETAFAASLEAVKVVDPKKLLLTGVETPGQP